MPGENLGINECLCDSGGLKQKFVVKEVLPQVTTNSVIKNQIWFKEAEVSALSVLTATLSFHDGEHLQDLHVGNKWQFCSPENGKNIRTEWIIHGSSTTLQRILH